MVPADHPVNGQVFTKAPPTGPADIRVTFTRWNDQYLSCQPFPSQLLPSLTADIVCTCHETLPPLRISQGKMEVDLLAFLVRVGRRKAPALNTQLMRYES